MNITQQKNKALWCGLNYSLGYGMSMDHVSL